MCKGRSLEYVNLATSLLPLRAFYFFSFGALGALFPFLPLLLEDRGLSASQISWIMALLPVSGLFVPPLWGSLADALQARVPLLRLASVLCGASALLLLPRWGFWGHFMAVGALCVFRSPIITLADAVTCSALGGQSDTFGRVRVWGSVGFAFFVWLLGMVHGSSHPVLLLWVTCAIYVLSAAVTLPLRHQPVDQEHGLLGQARAVMLQPGMMLYLLANAVYYSGHATFDAFFSLHARALGFSDPFIGLAWTSGVGVEILVMLAAPLLLRHVRAVHLLALCALAAMGRWTALSLITSGPPLLASQALHGLTFGLWYLSMVRFLQARVPERLRASLQSVTMAFMGLGMTTGYLAGGQILQQAGGHALYRYAAGAATLSFVLYLLVARLAPPPVKLEEDQATES